jgi:hypothetical protein
MKALVRISLYIDWVINWLKWPAAVVALVLLPFTLLAGRQLLRQVLLEPRTMGAFVLGLLLYVVLWRAVLRYRLLGTFFSTLEHELTHALFALATLHPVVELRSTLWRGGHVKFRGVGNWLITISPYFFPTLSFAIIAATALIPDAWRWWADALLGAATAYHVISTFHETRPIQQDLRQTGFVFSWMFLPTANLISLGIVIAFCHAGIGGVLLFLKDVVPGV